MGHSTPDYRPQGDLITRLGGAKKRGDASPKLLGQLGHVPGGDVRGFEV